MRRLRSTVWLTKRVFAKSSPTLCCCLTVMMRSTRSPGKTSPAMPEVAVTGRSEEHTSELQSLMRISYAVFCLKKKKKQKTNSTSSANHYYTYHYMTYQTNTQLRISKQT